MHLERDRIYYYVYFLIISCGKFCIFGCGNEGCGGVIYDWFYDWVEVETDVLRCAMLQLLKS